MTTPRWRLHITARMAATLVLTWLVAACATTVDVTRSPNDDRDYEYRVLDNGLSVLLVSDPAADKAAASLVVDAGWFDDPPDRSGLAHFLEHMLFLGTEKYPDTDEYQRYISTYGGRHNAYTSGDHTNYFFDIQPDRLEGALDRFAQFFVAPRLDAEYVDREKNAVDSEYQLYFNDDAWRGFHVNKLAMNPAHPGSRFNVGSLGTLAGDVRTDLLRFYEQHYSADRMSLVVLGPQSVGELRTWATAMFGAVPRRATLPPTRMPPLYASGALPTEVRFKTVKDTRLLNFNFPVPSLDPYWRQKPGDFIANLLGHEGEGTLHAWLKSRGWIESLAAGAERFDPQNGLVTIALELTESGEAHLGEIEDAVYDYIALVRTSGLERWRYEEQARIAELSFRFEEKRSPMATVYGIAPDMRLYPPRDVLVAPYLMSGYDEAVLKRYLDALRPDNVAVEFASQQVEGTSVEPWFKVPYEIRRPAARAEDGAPTPGLALPAPNPFLPDRIDLLGAHEERPHRVVDTPGLALWLARDTSFGAPRANTFLDIEVEGGLATVEDAVNADLYARLVEDRLNAFAYPARMAGLAYDISADGRGYGIAISGFDDKQPRLLDALLETFAGLEIDEARFALYRDALKRELDNSRAERPFEQASAALAHLLVENAWPPELLARQVESATVDGLEAWRRTRLARVDVTGLLHGNLGEEAAKRVQHVLARNLPIGALPAFEPRVVAPREALRHRLDIDNADASFVLYVQGSESSIAERARYGLAAQIVAAPYFNELRTEQQLGYAVFASPALLRRTPGIAFTVQSPVAGPDALLGATEKFLADYRENIATMTPEEFEAHKQSLVSKLMEKDKNLAQRGARYWSDLDLGFLEFDSREQIAAAVTALTPSQFLAFYDGLLARVGKERLVVYSEGKFDEAPPGTEIDDVAAWKRSEEGSAGVSAPRSPDETPAAQPAASVHSAR